MNAPRATPWPADIIVRIAAGAAENEPALEGEWRRLRGLNPRLHDGPILSVTSIDAGGGAIDCRRSTYKRFVAGGDVRALGVTAVCVRRGRGGEEILMGRRAPGVRIYGGLWESAPRGAVEPADCDMTAADLAACIEAEGREEIAATFSLRSWRTFALVEDDLARSVDVCLLCEIDGAAGAGSWEYADRRWITRDELNDWVRGRGPAGAAGDLSPPWSALVALGW